MTIRRTLTAACLTLGVIVAAAPPAFTQQGPAPLSMTEWLERLERSHSLAVEGETAPSARTFAGILSALGLPVRIETAGGVLIVPRDSFLERLAGGGAPSARDFAAARARIELLAAEARQADALRPVSAAALRGALEDAYRGVKAERSLVERVLGWVYVKISRFLAALIQPRGATTVIAWLIVLASLGLLVAIFARAGVAPRRAARQRVMEERPEPVNWRELADAAFANGDVAAAVRYEFVRLLDTLADRELIPTFDSVTAGECRTLIRRTAPALVPHIDAASRAFEIAAYATHVIDVSAVTTVRAAIDAVTAHRAVMPLGAAA